MRNADELSNTVAPAAVAAGANRRAVSAPAENSAISMPLNDSSVSSLDDHAAVSIGDLGPAERSDARAAKRAGRNASYGKKREQLPPHSAGCAHHREPHGAPPSACADVFSAVAAPTAPPMGLFEIDVRPHRHHAGWVQRAVGQVVVPLDVSMSTVSAMCGIW